MSSQFAPEPQTPGSAKEHVRAAARDLLGPLRRATELHLAGNYDAAEARLRAVLALAPDLPQAHHHLSVVLHAKGKTVEAVRHLVTALEGDPHLVGASARLDQYLDELKSARSELTD